MRLLTSILLVSLSVSSYSFSLQGQQSKTCEITESDGSPTLEEAAQDSSCDIILIGPSTTVNVTTSLNMTGIENKHISVQGTIKFNPDLDYWSSNAFTFPFQTQSAFWLLGGNNILLDGGGTLDGSGQAWYDAFAKKSSTPRPILLTIFQATNVTVQNLRMINSPEWVNFVNEGNSVTFRNITISTSSISKNPPKNTDGWDIYRSDNVIITDSVVNNDDDCVSFKPNATNILVSNLSCNGSHGISVGSLGQYAGEYDIVQNVLATNITMSNAQNGARIKTWAGKGVGSGIVKNITFTGFVESNVDNPVVIDQCYETSESDCAKYPSNTLIEDIWFDNVSGTSSGKEKAVVASLTCSPGGRCTNVNVNGLSLEPPSKYGTPSFTCENVNLSGSSAGLFGTCTTTGS